MLKDYLFLAINSWKKLFNKLGHMTWHVKHWELVVMSFWKACFIHELRKQTPLPLHGAGLPSQ